MTVRLEQAQIPTQHNTNSVEGVDDPSALSEAFDNDAAESEDALRQLWRSNEGAIGQDFVEMFCREDRTRQLSSAARDPSTIPAPPDSLINDGLGFQVFLQAGRGLGRSPKDAVGEQTGPATIAYGRLGGLLEGSEPSAASPIEDTLERCSIAAASADTAADQPRTTEQARSQQGVGESSKASTVTDDERWELFRKNKFGPDAALLARHYVASVLAKESQNSKKVKKSDEGSTSDQAEAEAEVEVESSVDEWPAVGQLTFKDFTTWIIACKSADRKFGPVTMKSWRAQRQERHDTLSARLSAWEPPNGFGDGSSQYPKPKQYYNGKTLLALDLHIKSKPTKR